MFYLMMLSIHIVSIYRVINELIFGKDMKESGHGIIKVQFQPLPGGTERPQSR